MAKLILGLHTLFVVSIVTLGMSATIWTQLFPFAALGGIGTYISNHGRRCPLTDMENKYLGKDAYEGSCIVHYCKQWFGISISPLLVPTIYGACCAISLFRLLIGH